MPGPAVGAEQALFKPAGGGWIFSAPNPWTFARRRSFLVDDVQKADLVERIRRWRDFRPLLLAMVIWWGAQRHMLVAPRFLVGVFMIVYLVALNLCDYFAVRMALVGRPRTGLLEIDGRQARSMSIKAVITIALIEALAWAFLQSPEHSPYLLTAATCFCLLAILFTSKSKTQRAASTCQSQVPLGRRTQIFSLPDGKHQFSSLRVAPRRPVPIFVPTKQNWDMHGQSALKSAHRLLFRLDVGRLNDRPPFLELALVQDGKRLGCLLVRREYFLAETGEAQTHGRIGQRFYDRRVERVLGYSLSPLDCRFVD